MSTTVDSPVLTGGSIDEESPTRPTADGVRIRRDRGRGDSTDAFARGRESDVAVVERGAHSAGGHRP
jgi:hypothetical protein